MSCVRVVKAAVAAAGWVGGKGRKSVRCFLRCLFGGGVTHFFAVVERHPMFVLELLFSPLG